MRILEKKVNEGILYYKDTSKKTVFYGHIKNRSGIKDMVIDEKY